jgi:hypothetical protein
MGRVEVSFMFRPLPAGFHSNIGLVGPRADLAAVGRRESSTLSVNQTPDVQLRNLVAILSELLIMCLPGAPPEKKSCFMYILESSESRCYIYILYSPWLLGVLLAVTVYGARKDLGDKLISSLIIISN